MLAAIAAVFDTEESIHRRRRKQLMKLGDALVRYLREQGRPMAAILLAGRRVVFKPPGSREFDYLVGLRSSILVGTYDFAATDDVEAESIRAVADLDAALLDYWEGRFSHPAALAD